LSPMALGRTTTFIKPACACAADSHYEESSSRPGSR
jgi:hypothetical protein